MNATEQAIEALESVIGNSMIQTNHPMTCEFAEDALKALQSMQGEAVRCEYCDGTGDVHRADGEWMGECTECTHPQSPAVVDDYAALLKESAELFRFYEQSHRVRGPEHLEKASRNAEIAGRIEAMLTASGKGE